MHVLLKPFSTCCSIPTMPTLRSALFWASSSRSRCTLTPPYFYFIQCFLDRLYNWKWIFVKFIKSLEDWRWVTPSKSAKCTTVLRVSTCSKLRIWRRAKRRTSSTLSPMCLAKVTVNYHLETSEILYKIGGFSRSCLWIGRTSGWSGGPWQNSRKYRLDRGGAPGNRTTHTKVYTTKNIFLKWEIILYLGTPRGRFTSIWWLSFRTGDTNTKRNWMRWYGKILFF